MFLRPEMLYLSYRDSIMHARKLGLVSVLAVLGTLPALSNTTATWCLKALYF
jgi:hypothetical protein